MSPVPATIAVRVVVAQLCATVPGGTARYAAQLVRALARTAPPGAVLDAVASRPCAATAELPVPVRALHLPDPLLSRLWERGLPPWVARAGLVHAPTPQMPPSWRGSPVVVTIHDVVPWTHPSTLTARGVAFHRRIGARAARQAAAIVTPTEAVAAQVRELLDPVVPVVPVLSGVAITPVPADAALRRARLTRAGGSPSAVSAPAGGADAAYPYVLFVGTTEPRKGLDVAVAALASPQLAGVHLLVVGPPGWGDVRVLDLAAAAGVADRVVVTGPVSDADLAALYAGARALAMPSRAEGFGFPVLEAMAHGVPVVTSDDPALVEVGAGAALVAPIGEASPLAEALASVVDDGAARERLVVAGRERAAHLTWAQTAEHMWGLYSRLLAYTR